MQTRFRIRSVVVGVLVSGLGILLTACRTQPASNTPTPESTAAVKGVTAGLIAEKPEAGSGQTDTDGANANNAQPDPNSGLSAAASSKPAPDIPLPLKDGGATRHLSDYKGKVVVLDFWATWCGPCKMSIPELEKIYTKYHSQGLEVFGVSVDGDNTQNQIPEVEKELGVTYPIVLASGIPDVGSKFSADSIPSVFLIDKAGRIRSNIVGYSEGSDEEQEIETLLKE